MSACRSCGALIEHQQVRRLVCDDCKAKADVERKRKWAEANREKCRESRRRWVEANPDAMRDARRAWKAANPERVREHRRAVKRRNPVANRADVRRRKALLSGSAAVPFTRRQLEARMAYFGNRCWVCGGAFDEVDHVKPLAAGGPHVLSNLRPSCSTCNSIKRDYWPMSAVRERLRERFAL